MAERVRIAHMTTAHKPLDIRIFHKECKSLAEAGYDVSLLCRHDRHELIDGVRLVPLPGVSGRLRRVLTDTWRVYRAARRENAALYQFHDVHLVLAAVLMRLAGKRVVYDAHENVPAQVVSESNYSPCVTRLAAVLLRLLLKAATPFFDSVVTVNNEIAAHFPKAKAVLVRNYARVSEFANVCRRPYAKRPPVIAWAGGMSRARGTSTLVAAASLVDSRLGAVVEFAGPFASPEYEAELRTQADPTRVRFLGVLSREQVGDLFSRARAGTVLYLPGPNHMDASPNKLFEYMSAGLPVIVSNFECWRPIVEGHRCGIMVDPSDPEAIAAAIARILEDPREAEAMGARGRAAAIEKYCWESEATRLVALYERLVGPAHSPSLHLRQGEVAQHEETAS